LKIVTNFKTKITEFSIHVQTLDELSQFVNATFSVVLT